MNFTFNVFAEFENSNDRYIENWSIFLLVPKTIIVNMVQAKNDWKNNGS